MAESATTKGKCVKLGAQGDKVDSYHLLMQSSCESHPGMHWHFWSVQTPFLLQSTFVLHMNSEKILWCKFKSYVKPSVINICLPEQSAKLSQLALHWQVPDPSQKP